MPFTLTTITKKIDDIQNAVNREQVKQFRDYMAERDLSNNHQINNLKVMISFATYLGPETTFYQISKKEQNIAFLDTKKKDTVEDPERRWITTWNYYLNRLKLFFRWSCN